MRNSETVKEGEEGKGRERSVWGWALALSVSGRRTHLNTPSFGNGSTPLRNTPFIINNVACAYIRHRVVAEDKIARAITAGEATPFSGEERDYECMFGDSFYEATNAVRWS